MSNQTTNKDLQSLLNRYEKGQICVVADKALIRHDCWNRYEALREMPVLWLETDEAHKSIETVARIWDFLFENDITRSGLLVCVGGGVLTDIGGFAAATYKRGIDYINIPTTLLAMTDASSGGKTGCNYRGLKNSIGVFAAPAETIIDTQWLHTLPPRQFLSGYGEMLKTGLIDSSDFNGLWSRLCSYDLERMDPDELEPLIQDCIAVKEKIVTADPREGGLRKVLNLGHTFGHALEELSLQGEPEKILLHGYAVVYGLIAELYLSIVKPGCPSAPLQQLTQIVLHTYGKPDCKCSDRERLIAKMQQDKKNEHAGEINCTLLKDIGQPVINQVITKQEAEEALDYLFSI